MLSVYIKYSMCDLFLTSSVAVIEAVTWVKINVYDKIVTENQKKNMWNSRKLLHKSQSNRMI